VQGQPSTDEEIGEEEGTSEGGEDGQEPEISDEANDDDDTNTEGVASEQDSACPAVAFEGPSYLDEKGCPAPCPPPPPANAQDASTTIPEGCPNPAAEELASQPSSQTPEEQLASPGPNLDEAPEGVGGATEVCEDGKDNDGDGELDENGCVIASLVDSDGDGVPDSKEDNDGDGWVDVKDNCPAKPNSYQTDSNGNGVGDLCDTVIDPREFVDSDNDFSYEIRDNCPGTFNPDQKDIDRDGFGDACDTDPTGGVLSMYIPTDSDRDGVEDSKDNCKDISNHYQEDEDGNGVGNACQPDDTVDYGGPVEEPFRAPK
jgi:hypothetical protein